MWTITFRRFKRDRRGVSNIIVIALSLVVMLAIVSNIVLWNYEMNQVDWEKMKEEASITNVEVVTHSSWFVVQSEYFINTGFLDSGDFWDTHLVDDSYESFTEAAIGAINLTLIDVESFEGGWPPSGWSATGTWAKESNYAYEGIYSADFDGSVGGVSGYLTSPSMDCSDVDAIYVEFWWQDRALDDDNLILEYYDGATWNSYQDLNQMDSGNGWHHYTEVVTDSQYFVSNFQIRLWAKMVQSGKTACVDVVKVTKSVVGMYSLDLNGQFFIDLSTYPLDCIQTVELQIRYRVEDNLENWYLKVYNWTDSVYNDTGFNSTIGYTPTTGWDYYSLNLTDVWESYVHNNGTINVKFVDQGADSEQTSLDIDFLGVRVIIDGAQFTFENNGALTLHLVSLWMINSTDHQRYDINVFINSAASKNFVHSGISLPIGNYIVKVVTERGNMAVYSSN
ncbi:hypothetical protein ACFLRN_00190 [Thermoproteota archaeon]